MSVGGSSALPPLPAAAPQQRTQLEVYHVAFAAVPTPAAFPALSLSLSGVGGVCVCMKKKRRCHKRKNFSAGRQEETEETH